MKFLTSWKKQQKSNKDLYRFDLHCKIKHGVWEEFFETVREFFSTKYVMCGMCYNKSMS